MRRGVDCASLVSWLRFWEYSEADWAGLQFFVLVVAAIIALYQLHDRLWLFFTR